MPAQLAAQQNPGAQKILFGYYAAFFLLLVSFLLTFFTNNRLNAHSAEVERTDKIVRNIQALFAEVRSAESAFNGFLIIQDKKFLEPYNASYGRAAVILKELYGADIEKEHHQRLDTVSGLLKERYELFKSGLQLFYQYATSDSIVKKVENGKVLSDELQSQLQVIEISERNALKDRTSMLNMYAKAVFPVNLFTLVLAIILAVYALVTYTREKKAAIFANKLKLEKEEQLKQKVKELEKANEELVKFRRIEKFTATGRMARMIAHEVRNPLSNINLALGELKEEARLDENSTMFMNIIARSSERINQLVTDLLNATRIQDMKLEVVPINTLLDEALAAAADRTHLQHVKVYKDYSRENCQINADREKLKIAFLNLIVNAMEAMSAGNGTLRLKTEKKNGKCVVTIIDNGTGIDKESLSKLFEPYFTSKPKGSGLGLANTHAIILTHKGSIEVESEPGKGATFTVTLDCIE